jgi:hypothetical protein
MEDGDFLSGILCDGEGVHVDGLDDLNVSYTQDSTHVDGLESSRSGTKGVRQRAKNFTPDEDEVLCQGWLAISKDPVLRVNQSRTTFWGKVPSYYEEHNKSGVPRTESSIMHRFLSIQFSVNKFCACYDAVLRRNQSGTTIFDKV